MPPFYAVSDEECDMQLGLLDDVRLSDEEKAMLADWVADGMPEGDPAAAVPALQREINHIEDPDLVLTIPQPYEVTGDRDIYRCFRVEVPHDTDAWITGLEVLPDNDLVVHHVLVWNDPEDQSAKRAGPDGSYPCSGSPDVFPTELIAAWTPGGSPSRAPADSGTLFHPGASIVVNVHYHPTGTTTEVDQTGVAIEWTTTPPAYHTTWFLLDLPFGASVLDGPHDDGGAQFRIPAGVKRHVETVALTIPDLIPWDLKVFAITPHMHYLGTEMLVTVDRDLSDGLQDDECLIHTPNYRFDFQTSYVYDPSTGDLPVLHVGDTVKVRCTYDNSENNPFMPLALEASGSAEPHDVRWGEETGDEMCMAMVGLQIPPIDWLSLASVF
jgi:hypothetical protein